MNRDEIQQIRIEINAGGTSALSLLVARDGTLGRQGNGSLPAVGQHVLGMTDGSIFLTALSNMDPQILESEGVFDHPAKLGMPIRFQVALIGEKPKLRVLEFRLGLENSDVGDLLPRLDQWIRGIVSLTDDWYAQALTGGRTDASP